MARAVRSGHTALFAGGFVVCTGASWGDEDGIDMAVTVARNDRDAPRSFRIRFDLILIGWGYDRSACGVGPWGEGGEGGG